MLTAANVIGALRSFPAWSLPDVQPFLAKSMPRPHRALSTHASSGCRSSRDRLDLGLDDRYKTDIAAASSRLMQDSYDAFKRLWRSR